SQAEPAESSQAEAPAEAEAKPKRTRKAKAKKAEDSAAENAQEPAAEAPVESEPAEKQEAGEAPSNSEQPSGEKSSGDRDEHDDREERKGRRQRKQRQQKNGNGHQKNDRGDRNDRQKNDRYHNNRRQHQQNRREPVVPQTSKEELAKLKVAELREKAQELEIEFKGLKKAELVEAVFAASVKAEGFEEVSGILDVLSDGYGFLRTNGYLPSEKDVYVGTSTIRRNHLRKGDYLTGQTRPARPKEKFAALQRIDTVNGTPLEELGKRVRFADLTPVFPDERLVLEHGRSSITSRVIDLCAPIGKGQRGLIVSPPKAGKTTILKDIAASITANNPEVHLMCLLVDERPEEVTDMERSIHGEVISSTFDMPCENHVAVSEMVIERAKRLVENGRDVVILLDSLTRLARAYNLAQPASGRILSGGVDSTALYPPKKFLGAARNIEGGGSLTILASALIETGSKMDEVIFEEFKGTGNMEVKLDRSLAEHRIFPAIDPVASGTRREDLLLDPQEAPLIWAVRRVLANRNNVERAMDSLIKSLKQTNDNQEFLMRAAKKAQQGRHFDDNAPIEI
ncbi:MAG: transcription termination factor Rho, partial [Eggerthellaceae bacterium]|nr:transcription termination factor Rho [Eggerthellaceae bacterium]